MNNEREANDEIYLNCLLGNSLIVAETAHFQAIKIHEPPLQDHQEMRCKYGYFIMDDGCYEYILTIVLGGCDHECVLECISL